MNLREERGLSGDRHIWRSSLSERLSCLLIYVSLFIFVFKCDFGSAKHLVRGEPNVSYICSRYYRAPELIFGATDYTSQIG